MTSAPWQAAWDRAQPTLNTIRDSQSNPPSDGARILRVGQLDAELLDQELVQVLQQPLANALGLVNPTWKTRFTPELQLLLHLVLYKLSVWDTGASYGAKLQGLRYQPSDIRSPRTRLAHGALTVLLPYLHALLRARALSSAWPEAPASDPRRRAWDALSRAESAHALLALVNFVGFLWNGRYRTLADRLLRLRLVPAQRLVRRDVSYEFMNRQMVWHAFTEFLLFLLPLINLRLVRRRLTRLLAHTSSSLLSLLPTPIRAPTTTKTPPRLPTGKYALLPPDRCAICADQASHALDLSSAADAITLTSSLPSSSSPSAPITDADDAPPPFPLHTPYAASCGHLYCYVCLSSALLRAASDDEPWPCLRCAAPVRWAARHEVPPSTPEDASEDDDGASFFGAAGDSSLDGYEFTSGASALSDGSFATESGSELGLSDTSE